MKDKLNEKKLNGEMLESVSGGEDTGDDTEGSKFKKGDYVRFKSDGSTSIGKYVVVKVYTHRSSYRYQLRKADGMPYMGLHPESDLEFWSR